MHPTLPNSDKWMKSILKDVIHAPDMAFTLISVRRLDHAKCSVTFEDGMCMIKNPTSCVMAKFPHSNGLYHINQNWTQANSNYTTLAAGKMDINQAHWKLDHIGYAVIKHVVSNGLILGLDIDLNSKLEFCEACVKGKATWVLFPKQSFTRATNYGEHIHWDLLLDPIPTLISDLRYPISVPSTHSWCSITTPISQSPDFA